jgi:uncharacterized protein (DUF111 family)
VLRPPTSWPRCSSPKRRRSACGASRPTRLERPRRIVEVVTRFGRIPLKVSEGPYGAPQVKPEFDVCEQAAAASGVPLREVLAEALSAWALLTKK